MVLRSLRRLINALSRGLRPVRVSICRLEVTIPVDAVSFTLFRERQLLRHIQLADNLRDSRSGQLVLAKRRCQRHIRQTVTVKDDSVLSVEVEHVHLVLGALLAVELLLVLGQVHHLVLRGLQLAHHLERVCRLSLLFFDDNKVNVRPFIRFVVLKQKASRLRDRVLVHDHIDVEDTVGL